MDRAPDAVARDHIEAVRSGEPVAMAADYDADAVLERADGVYEGRAAIEAYFATVPARLGSATVVFDALSVVDNVVTFSWHLEGGSVDTSGTDVCTIKNGLIVHQLVRLNDVDF